MQQDEVTIPEEGDVVIWRQKSELIIKAKLGQRREHVIDHPRIDHLSYEPHYERFIGQFSIDYVPEPFPQFTEQERMDFEAEDAKKLHAFKSMHPLEFSLMLNGVKATATDRSIYSEQALDDINQVKVEIGGLGLSDDFLTTRERHARFLKSKSKKKGSYDKKSSDEYGMECYTVNDGGPLSHALCFGASTYAAVSGISFSIIGNNWVFAKSYEPIYGGIEVKYRIDKSNLKHWKEVDAAIWRLLERWNVSLVATPIKN